MRIIQITDLHIHPAKEFVNGINTKENLLKVLKDITKIHYDFVVLTGDLCFSDGDETVYYWIKEQMENHNIKDFYVIGGNHDNAYKLAKVFGNTDDIVDDELYFFKKPNMIFLDTIKGYCSDKQLEWFAQKIKSIQKTNPIIFMHHPPFKSGVPHMDNKYAFQQTDKFIDICNLNKNVKYVFTGHYHNEISIFSNNINMYITPSTYVQIYMFAEEFVEDHSNPAFRIIDIDDSQLKTTVRYVFD